MAQVTLEQVYNEVIIVKTVLLGVPNSDDKGLIGEVEKVNEHLGRLNTKVQNNTLFISKLKGILIVLGAGGGSIGALVGILKAIGVL